MQADGRIEIEERIKQILISQLEIEPDIFAGDGSTIPLLGRGIGLDSMETLTLAAAVEEEFDIQVDDADLTVGLFKNISTLAEYVLKKSSEQKGRPEANAVAPEATCPAGGEI